MKARRRLAKMPGVKRDDAIRVSVNGHVDHHVIFRIRRKRAITNPHRNRLSLCFQHIQYECQIPRGSAGSLKMLSAQYHIPIFAYQCVIQQHRQFSQQYEPQIFCRRSGARAKGCDENRRVEHDSHLLMISPVILGKGKHRHHPSRSPNRCSATRIAFAITVSEGFTALAETKHEASTT